MKEYDVFSVHDDLKNKLIDYIIAQYLGNNDLLTKLGKKELSKMGNLYQKPFLESNKRYKIFDQGFSNLEIPADIKSILLSMKENGLIKYNPYVHQGKALEYFYGNYDLLVSTGTGSGKTECFMWPLATKLLDEAINKSETWNTRGIRTIVLYPMNALVSDQLGRLRTLMGDHEGVFQNMFFDLAGEDMRIPQFGMFTGRTPYPNIEKKKRDENLANMLESELIPKNEKDEKFINELINIGKYPSKHDLSQFIESLREGKGITNKLDSELMTRHEMRVNCPDILITNYSMLQYMLVREIDKPIWENTKKWLNAAPENKLLFVIDEAHMYKGAAGGEVSLLIRRVLHTLGIGRDKVQFILTSASIPEGKDDAVIKFATDLTAAEDNSFKLIKGELSLYPQGSKSIDKAILASMNTEGLFEDEDRQKLTIEKYLNSVEKHRTFASLKEAQIALYKYLIQNVEVVKILNSTMSEAYSLEELEKTIFGNDSLSHEAFKNLLTIMPLALNEAGQFLFPARLHMFFNGLKGIWACINPNCNESNKMDGASLGHVYFDYPRSTCDCGGKIYELVNDRRCGALFLKGYVEKGTSQDSFFIWNAIDNQNHMKFEDILLYLIDNETDKLLKNGGFGGKSKEYMRAYLNIYTGYLYCNGLPVDESENDYVQVLYKFGKDGFVFSECPKCLRSSLNASSFSLRGNEAFYNVISEQFRIQPPKYHDEDLIKKFPNEGKKLLLFSDSRQRAAVLAKDLTRSSNQDTMRSIIIKAAQHLREWANENGKQPKLSLLYVAVLEIICKENIPVFYGDDIPIFEDHKEKYLDYIENMDEDDDFEYEDFLTDIQSSYPIQYQEQIVLQLCSNYISLMDIGIGYLKPIFDKRQKNKIKKSGFLSTTEFEDFFVLWSTWVLKDSKAIDAKILPSTRNNVVSSYNRFGLKIENIIPDRIKNNLLKRYSEEQVDFFYKRLKKDYLVVSEDSSKTYYINPEKVYLYYDEKMVFYKCKKCGAIQPSNFLDFCLSCQSENTLEKVDPNEVEKLQFWRKPVIDNVNNKKRIIGIDTEEHTAQLSYKDEDSKMWSTTENYEMRFQDVVTEGSMPIDILSSTTTMEVGIDIGSLTAVGLRNIPPLRENYQQRAGRAGRKGSRISTIVSFADNGPHDAYYFKYPEKIIKGELREPWIDADNDKLIFRHISVVLLTKFARLKGFEMDDKPIMGLIEDYENEIIEFVNNVHLDSHELEILIPGNSIKNIDSYKACLADKLNSIFKKVKKNPQEYSKKASDKTAFDIFLEEGIVPSYSFPKNVIGFTVDNKSGYGIEEQPQRSIDIALSEYAPGRIVVINKKTYRSGGIYNFYSRKFANDKNEDLEPAKRYFQSRDYKKIIYSCENPGCSWIGIEKPENGKCPFCGEDHLKQNNMLIPWGFGAENGTTVSEANAKTEYSYSERPCYSATPSKDMMKQTGYPFIRKAKKSEEKLIVLNRGVNGEGFMVCKKCGAAVNAEDAGSIKGMPFIHKNKSGLCVHDLLNVYLGAEFYTDMAIFEFKLNSDIINTSFDGMWLESASSTLAEALLLAASTYLDVDYSELKVGHRYRMSGKDVYVDIYIFDSLSSGAGYSSKIYELEEILFKEAKAIMIDCDCETTCHKCLNNFWNQQQQSTMDRHLGLQLLEYGTDGVIPEELPTSEQKILADPLLKLLHAENYAYNCNSKGEMLISKGSKSKRLVIYPEMWSKDNNQLNSNNINISKKRITTSLPTAFKEFEDQFKQR